MEQTDQLGGIVNLKGQQAVALPKIT